MNEKLNEIYPILLSNARKITRGNKQEAEEVLQIVILSFLEMSEERRMNIINNGKLEHFVTKGVALNFHSSTSPYHRMYRKRKHNELYDVHPQQDEEWRHYYHERCDCVEEAVKELHWYSQHLIKEKFYEGLTYNELHKKYNISLNALVRDIKEGLLMIKEKCNE